MQLSNASVESFMRSWSTPKFVPESSLPGCAKVQQTCGAASRASPDRSNWLRCYQPNKPPHSRYLLDVIWKTDMTLQWGLHKLTCVRSLRFPSLSRGIPTLIMTKKGSLPLVFSSFSSDRLANSSDRSLIKISETLVRHIVHYRAQQGWQVYLK